MNDTGLPLKCEFQLAANWMLAARVAGRKRHGLQEGSAAMRHTGTLGHAAEAIAIAAVGDCSWSGSRNTDNFAFSGQACEPE